MTESVDRQTAVLRLRGADDILILCHKNPDGDTIGCAGALYLALKALGKNAAILCSDPIPKMYDYMELRWFDGSFNPAFVVAVDVASIQLFGENNNVPQYAAHTNLCIDHHASNSGYAYETLVDDHAAAAAELQRPDAAAEGRARERPDVDKRKFPAKTLKIRLLPARGHGNRIGNQVLHGQNTLQHISMPEGALICLKL